LPKYPRLTLSPVAGVFLLCLTTLPVLGQGAPQADSKQDAKAQAKSKPASSSPDSKTQNQAPSGYRVGAEDELAIAVWHEPELSQQVVVRPDGMITLPLLNDIKVAGLTMEELQTLLTERLKTVVNDPQVTVSVKAVKSRKVFLVGNVTKQGVYILGSHMTVLELIAEAGGLGPFAKGGSIYVLRKDNDKETRLPFNYKKALSGKGSNPELQPDDMVVVP
jgi:polysaccharide biosynthesis/export protein